MSRFTGPLIIEERAAGRLWRLREPIVYEAGAEGSGRRIEVPAGMETDGATIPAALRIMLAVWGTYGRAAAIHDYLYSILREGRLTDEDGEPHPAFVHAEGVDWSWDAPDWITTRQARRWADAEFFTAMIACGTSRPLAWIIWAAVRLFAASAARPA